MKEQKNIIVFVMNVRPRMIQDLKAYGKSQNKTYRIMVVRDTRCRKLGEKPDCDIYVECDFSRPNKISEALLPYQDQLLAISCRFEQHIARFAAVIPHVPYLRTPNTESLTWATDKYEMRRRFKLFCPANNPKFTQVKVNTKKERQRVVNKVGFPMIVKPTNLAGSLFVNICYHEEDLERVLRTAFRKIKTAYTNDTRLEDPKIIAEAYMEGDLYSIDSYVNSRGQVYHCPLVRQKTARDIGRDDFFNHLQITPTALKSSTVKRAEAVAEDAIHALGLRSVTAHTELMKVDDEWKIVETGPRPGGIRDQLYKLSCDIDHTVNDILIRIPRKPVIPKKCKGFSAYMKFFAEKEGIISEMKGVKKIETLESFHAITINKRVGDRAVSARNGGRAVFTAILYNSDRAKLLADIRRIEKIVSIKVTHKRIKK